MNQGSFSTNALIVGWDVFETLRLWVAQFRAHGKKDCQQKVRGKQNQTSPNAHYGLKPLWVQRNGVGVRKSQLLRRTRGCDKIAYS